MINVVKKGWEEINERYSFLLEDGDIVFIPEAKYDLIQIHTSLEGKKLKAIVNERVNEYSEPVEYIGFEIVL